jgi:hypothetical protein
MWKKTLPSTVEILPFRFGQEAPVTAVPPPARLARGGLEAGRRPHEITRLSRRHPGRRPVGNDSIVFGALNGGGGRLRRNHG